VLEKFYLENCLYDKMKYYYIFVEPCEA